MNIARLVVIDGSPAIVIYAKTHGTHQHTDINGFTNRETGVVTCVRFEDESIPDQKDKEAITTWLINKAQRVMGMIIEARSWDNGGIDIMRWQQPRSSKSDQPTPAAA